MAEQIKGPVGMRVERTKEPVLAGVLEWLVPGAGLMYAGKVRAGVFVLIGTLLGTLIGFVFLVAALFPGYWAIAGIPGLQRVVFPVVSPAREYLLLVALAAECLWLVARIVWSVRSVVLFNRMVALYPI